MHSVPELVLQLSDAGAYLKKVFCAVTRSECTLSQGLLVVACVILCLRRGLFFFFLFMGKKPGQRHNWKQGQCTSYFLWSPQSSSLKPLLLLINDLPAVCTNFMAFMYAEPLCLWFLPYSPVSKTVQSQNQHHTYMFICYFECGLIADNFPVAFQIGRLAEEV